MVLLSQITNTLVVTVGDTIFSVDVENKSLKTCQIPEPKIPANVTSGQLAVLKEGNRNITSISFSKNRDLVVVATENKFVVVFNQYFEIVKEIVTNRAPSKVIFTPQNDIVLADKTGDVILYKLCSDSDEQHLLLGHLSMLTDMKISDCGKYIITCDRDEKIRVSCYPNSYNIVSYCLGHTEFVTSIELYDDLLISASGDGTVRLWNFHIGEELYKINTNEYIENDSAMRSFYKEMDSNNVEVNALPVVNLQILIPNLIAVSVLHSNIQIYKLEKTNYLQVSFLKKIPTDFNVIAFSLGLHSYILTDTGFLVYKLIDGYCFENVDSPFINEIYKKYEELFVKYAKLSEVSVLYKRRFDNVQDYLERKKMRLVMKT